MKDLVHKDLVHKGFEASSTIERLAPVEALALINRWAKLKSYFHRDDIDALYELKDQKISEFVCCGEMIATAVIVRESPAIAAMRSEINNSGKNLSFLKSFSSNVEDFLSEGDSCCLSLLKQMALGYGIEVEYPQDIYDRWFQEIHDKLQDYEIQKQKYDYEVAQRQPIVTEYRKQLEEYQNSEACAAKQWAEKNNIKIPRSNSGKSLKKNWLKILKNQGFKYSNKPPVSPFSTKLVLPQKPQLPLKTYKVNFETYLPGSIPEVESAISFARSIAGDKFPESYSQIDDEFIFELETFLENTALHEAKEEVLKVFVDIVENRLTNPIDIWRNLISFEIDYSDAIGMNSYIDNWGSISHAQFGKWHETNLSPKGYWLVKFQSLTNLDIIFHIPYEQCQKLNLINIKNNTLPKVEVGQVSFGREINSSEQKNYPIAELVEILGVSQEDFPYSLQRFEKAYRNHHHSWENYEIDEDDVDED